jgi:hypothetical protein
MLITTIILIFPQTFSRSSTFFVKPFCNNALGKLMTAPKSIVILFGSIKGSIKMTSGREGISWLKVLHYLDEALMDATMDLTVHHLLLKKPHQTLPFRKDLMFRNAAVTCIHQGMMDVMISVKFFSVVFRDFV